MKVKAGIVFFRETTCGLKTLIVMNREGKWSIPKGKLKRYETTKEAAIREAKEETSIKPRNLKRLGRFIHRKVIMYIWVAKVTCQRLAKRTCDAIRAIWVNADTVDTYLPSWQAQVVRQATSILLCPLAMELKIH